MDYAKRFKEIMKERNLTQQDLAKMAGVRQQSISNWMGKRYPNPKYIEKICEALGMKAGHYLSLSLELRVNWLGGVLPYPGTVEAPQRCSKGHFRGDCNGFTTLSCIVVGDTVPGQSPEYASDNESSCRYPDCDPPVGGFYTRYLNIPIPCPLI